MKTKHTSEPWNAATHKGSDDAEIHGGQTPLSTWIAIVKGCQVKPEEMEANAERIVACVNALAGLNPEAVRDVVEALEFYADEVPSTAADQDAGKKARAALAKLKS